VKPKNLKNALSKFLNEKEMGNAITSFDIIGDIAIIDIPEEMKKYEKKIGKALMEVHTHLKTVCKRAGIHKGEFRIRPVKVIAGVKKTITEYKESGASMIVDVNKVYFTPRLCFERERIAKQVKKGEKIGYFFAGVGPFGLVILKKNPNVQIDAVELNPDAFELLQENILRNKFLKQMTPILADVNEFSKKKYDRILMPLPKTGDDFLQSAFKCSKKGTVIHFYFIGERNQPFEMGAKVIKEKAKQSKIKYKILKKRICRPFSPSKVQVVFDIKVI